MENILNIEDWTKQKNNNNIDITYKKYKKDNKDNKDNISIEDEKYLISTIASLYCDYIYINKENNQNEDTILENTIQTIFENIKENLLKILSLEEKIDKIFKQHVDNIFKKINKFKDDIFRNEGPKDKILFLFFMKKIDFFLKNQKKKIINDKGSMNSSYKISSTEITSCLDICKIIKDYENINYKINTQDNITYNFNPSFTDQTLIYGLSNIIAYIKACFIIYSIHICSAIYNAFPMLFKSLMKIKELNNKSLFDNKNSNKNTTDLLKELEIRNGNSNITYLYRQILNSPICINKQIYNSLKNKKRYKITNGEEDKTKKDDVIFTKTSELIGDFTYNINLSNHNTNKIYSEIYDNIKKIGNNTITKLINGVYNKEITKIKKEKKTLISLLKKITQENKNNFCNIFFKENNTKYIADESIIYFYRTSNDEDLEKVTYDNLYPEITN